jgi:hypothetical protein
MHTHTCAPRHNTISHTYALTHIHTHTHTHTHTHAYTHPQEREDLLERHQRMKNELTGNVHALQDQVCMCVSVCVVINR